MKQVLAIITLLAGLAGMVTAPAGHGGPEREIPVVIQVSDNDPAKWNLALNNAANIQQALGKDNIEIEIVAYGPGLNMLKAESKVAGPHQRRDRQERRHRRLRQHDAEDEAHQGRPYRRRPRGAGRRDRDRRQAARGLELLRP